MRILVASDAHGAVAPLEKAIERSKPDYVIFLGDGLSRIMPIAHFYSDIKFYFVKGNCDFSGGEEEMEIKLGGKKLFFAHGYTYHVKMGYEQIINEGKRRNADIVLFGHTHIPINEYSDGMYIMNPGSIARPYIGSPSYGFIDIIDGQIVTNIVNI